MLPKELLERLGSKEGDTLLLTEALDGSMRATPYDPDFEAQMRAGREGMSAYRNTLAELAK